MRKFNVKLESNKSSPIVIPKEINKFTVYGLNIEDACERASIKIKYLTDGNKPTFETGVYSGYIYKRELGFDLTFSICMQNAVFQ